LSSEDAKELFEDSYSYSYGSYSYDSADGKMWNTESGRRLLQSNPTANPTYLSSEDAKELFEYSDSDSDSYSYSYGSYSYDLWDGKMWNTESVAPSADPSASPTSLPTAVPTSLPTAVPTTSLPTAVPTTSLPTTVPTSLPTAMPTLMTYEIEFSVAINMEDYGYQTNSTHAAAVIGKSTALLFDGAGGSANAGADGYAGADADCLASPLSLTLAHPPPTTPTPHHTQ